MNSKICKRCGHWRKETESQAHEELIEVIIVHSSYGCETGCCGHNIVAQDKNEDACSNEFSFIHPDFNEDYKIWATSLADNSFPTIPLNWEKCEISGD